MSEAERGAPASPTAPENTPTGKVAFTPEVVEKVAERVFALLLRDLRLERERFRPQKAQKRPYR